MIKKVINLVFGLFFALFITACSSELQPISSDKATTDYHSQISDLLRKLPPPKKPIIVAIYKFRDQTGQYKSNDTITQYSTAVTQGGTSMLIRALMEAGNGRWFTVLEREGLTDLMNERKIINQTRDAYIPEKDRAENKSLNLPPMLYAPVLLEGGVIAYETNLLTGGAGARYFGIGGSTEFRRDTVTTMLRAVAVKNGEVLSHVDSRKTILSMQLDSGLYRFVSYQRLMEFEAGISSNEPPQMAVLESIEACVYAMIVEGVIKNTWSLADPSKKTALIAKYLNRNVDKSEVEDEVNPVVESDTKPDQQVKSDNVITSQPESNSKALSSLDEQNKNTAQQLLDEERKTRALVSQRVKEELESNSKETLKAEQESKVKAEKEAIVPKEITEQEAKVNAAQEANVNAEQEAKEQALAQAKAEKEARAAQRALARAERKAKRIAEKLLKESQGTPKDETPDIQKKSIENSGAL